ncbi:ATP-binding protein, partial [Streptomyces sp. NPDC059744]|uniref:ATP-binding protein n=1 Tax=Streptomyces sp. NPDC059744 TaxID=3346929 RepID=UPI003654FF7B
GEGTPCTLTVEMRDAHLRIGLRDPDPRALPTLLSARPDAESGRGLALVDAVSERWGVILGTDFKFIWCELATQLTSASGHIDDPRVAKGEAWLTLYASSAAPSLGEGRTHAAFQQEAAIDLIADLLHWLRAHGYDPDDALDRAQMHFEAELSQAG